MKGLKSKTATLVVLEVRPRDLLELNPEPPGSYICFIRLRVPLFPKARSPHGAVHSRHWMETRLDWDGDPGDEILNLSDSSPLSHS
jgi:hypothetical protein